MLNHVLAGTYVLADAAQYITTAVEAEMKQRFPDAKRYYYVHDFSGISGYETSARRIMTDWGMSRRHEVQKVIVVTSPMNPLVRMGVGTAVAILRVAGMNIEISESLADTIARYGLRVDRRPSPRGTSHGPALARDAR